MKMDLVNQTFDKYWGQKMVNFILGRRLCRKCAKKEWKNEDKTQSFTMLLGFCEKCHKPGIVAYIEKHRKDGK